MLVQLNKCVVVICKEGILMIGVCLRRVCLNMSVVLDICLFCVGPGYDVLLWGVVFWSDVRCVVWCL